MGRRQISLKDKQTLKRNLALDKSMREAIEGTDIKSNNTAMRYAHKYSHEIAQLRQSYVNTIFKHGADNEARAKSWAELTKDPNPLARRDALKYVDSLVGVSDPELETPTAPPAITINLTNINAQSQSIDLSTDPASSSVTDIRLSE